MEGGFIDRYMQRWVDGHMERRQHGNKTQQFLHLSECVRCNPTPFPKKCIQKWTNLTVVSEAWQLWVTETCKCVKVTVTCDSCASQNVFFRWYETQIFGSKTWEDGLKNTGNHGTPNNRKMIEMTVWFKDLETTAFCGKYRWKWNMVTQTQITRGLSKTVTIFFLPSELE